MKKSSYHALALMLLLTAKPLQAEEKITWQQCVSEASQAHPDLYGALALMQQAEADRRIAAASGLPQLSVGLSSQESGRSAKGSGAASLFSYSFTARHLLYDGGKTSSLVSGSEESAKAARYNCQALSSDVRFALRSAFSELLRSQKLVGLAGEIADRRRKNLRLITLRYQGGREHLGALRQAEADLAEAEFELCQAGRGLVLREALLASALGRDQHQPIRVQGEFRATEPAAVKPDIALLARNHPLFQELDARSKAARFNLDASRSAFAPQLSLGASLGKSAVDQFPVKAVDWSAALSVALPLYEGGSGRAKVSRAMAVVSQLNAAEKSGYLQLFDSLEESWKNMIDGRWRVTVQKKYLDAAVERSTIADAQYSNGLITFNEWVIIENNLVSAKKGFLNAEADNLIAEAQWIHAKGDGLDGQKE